MGKLKKDITPEKMWKWAVGSSTFSHSRDGMHHAIGALVERMAKGDPVDLDYYPDSFYQQPPIGSFGKFADGDLGKPKWGYLSEICDKRNGQFRKQGGTRYTRFTPGLPSDVDANGWPK